MKHTFNRKVAAFRQQEKKQYYSLIAGNTEYILNAVLEDQIDYIGMGSDGNMYRFNLDGTVDIHYDKYAIWAMDHRPGIFYNERKRK